MFRSLKQVKRLAHMAAVSVSLPPLFFLIIFFLFLQFDVWLFFMIRGTIIIIPPPVISPSAVCLLNL